MKGRRCAISRIGLGKCLRKHVHVRACLQLPVVDCKRTIKKASPLRKNVRSFPAIALTDR